MTPRRRCTAEIELGPCGENAWFSAWASDRVWPEVRATLPAPIPLRGPSKFASGPAKQQLLDQKSKIERKAASLGAAWARNEQELKDLVETVARVRKMVAEHPELFPESPDLDFDLQPMELPEIPRSEPDPGLIVLKEPSQFPWIVPRAREPARAVAAPEAPPAYPVADPIAAMDELSAKIAKLAKRRR